MMATAYPFDTFTIVAVTKLKQTLFVHIVQLLWTHVKPILSYEKKDSRIGFHKRTNNVSSWTGLCYISNYAKYSFAPRRSLPRIFVRYRL